jgi:hypothetical protein
MKLLIIILLATIAIGCSTKKVKIEKIKIEYPFEFVDTKSESIGNKMDLYAPLDKLNLQMLKALCKEQKESWQRPGFYFLVVFDNKENAVFPRNPFTAWYGVDETPQKHIIALFEYNASNGYSNLTVYSENMWESSPVSIKIK